MVLEGVDKTKNKYSSYPKRAYSLVKEQRKKQRIKNEGNRMRAACTIVMIL
jgi:hypothetical protein